MNLIIRVRILSILHLYVIILCIPLLISFSPLKEEFTMVGLWKTDVMGTIEQMSADKRSTYESRPEPVNQVFRESLSNRYYEFKNDGTVIYSFTREGSKRSYQGTWKYNSDTGELVTIHDGTKTTLIVGLLSTDQIILKKDKYDERSMINNLVLLRISD